MPYDAEKSGDVKKVIEKLKKTYKNVSDTAARQAIHVLNSVMDSTGDEGKAWASVYSKMNERGLAKNADVRFTTYDDPSYEVDVAGVELEFSPMRGGRGVRIDMGKHGEGGYVVLDPQQFANLAVELRQALAFVEGQSRTASPQGKVQSMARRVASRHDALKNLGVMKVAGGTDFMNFVQGSDAKRCFREAQEDAAAAHREDWESENFDDDDGWGGAPEYEASYTGTIAEKHEFVFRSREPMSRADAYKFADKDINHNDKWGPAFAIPVADPSGKRTIGYLFYGIASS